HSPAVAGEVEGPLAARCFLCSSAINTSPTLSPAVNFRIHPNCAVRQNWQSTAHPACVEMQMVCRPSLGMYTASTAALLSRHSPLVTRHFVRVWLFNSKRNRTDTSFDTNF